MSEYTLHVDMCICMYMHIFPYTYVYICIYVYELCGHTGRRSDRLLPSGRLGYVYLSLTSVGVTWRPRWCLGSTVCSKRPASIPWLSCSLTPWQKCMNFFDIVISLEPRDQKRNKVLNGPGKDSTTPVRFWKTSCLLLWDQFELGGALLDCLRLRWKLNNLGSKYPTVRHLPKTIITIPNTETLNTL